LTKRRGIAISAPVARDSDQVSYDVTLDNVGDAGCDVADARFLAARTVNHRRAVPAPPA
jgi:hypothetical protein